MAVLGSFASGAMVNVQQMFILDVSYMLIAWMNPSRWAS
jgi:hypothetical protein